jgi:nitroreductase
MKVTEAVLARHSTREFLPDPVPLDTVKRLLELASRAPSGGNTQPWNVYVVHGSAKTELTKAAFGELAKGNAGDSVEFNIYPPPAASAKYMDRRRKLGFEMYDLMNIARTDAKGRGEAMAKNFDFFGE